MRADTGAGRQEGDGVGRRHPVRPEARGRGDRCHHLLHQHQQPQRDDGGRSAGQEGRRAGLMVKPWVKTSMAPGSTVVTSTWMHAGLTPYLEALALPHGRLRLHHLHRQQRPAARTHRLLRCRAASWWSRRCSPAIATSRDVSTRWSRPTTWPARRWLWPTPWPARSTSTLQRAAGQRIRAGQPVYLRDIWPSAGRDPLRNRAQPDVPRCSASSTPMSSKVNEVWRKIAVPEGRAVSLGPAAPTSRRRRSSGARPRAPAGRPIIRGARVLALLGDSVTTDHISPAGSIAANSPAGQLPGGARGQRRRSSTPTDRGAAITR